MKKQISTINANDIKTISREAILGLLTDESKTYIEYLISLLTECASRGEICVTIRFDDNQILKYHILLLITVEVRVQLLTSILTTFHGHEITYKLINHFKWNNKNANSL